MFEYCSESNLQFILASDIYSFQLDDNSVTYCNEDRCQPKKYQVSSHFYTDNSGYMRFQLNLLSYFKKARNL